MDQEHFELELKRFNELMPAAAANLMKAAVEEVADFRSCWYCNGAHEHLKKRKLLRCFACGVLYASGFPWIVLMKRAQAIFITAQELEEYRVSWEDA